MTLPAMDPDVIPRKSMLGEAPVWNHRTSRLYWVDCDRKQIFRSHHDGSDIECYDLDGSPGSYAFSNDGALIIAYRTKLALVDLEKHSSEVLPTPMVDFSNARFNDGACDRAGRFWVGTMHKGMSEPVGALYRIDPDFSIRQMADGCTVSNGIAFSPDDKVMYHTDSKACVIYAYDFDVDYGEISNRRVFADLNGGQGRPDGCTVDSDGRLWTAMLGGSRVAVFDPDARPVGSLHLPVSRPTSLCFGGPALETLYVTSMQHSLTEVEIAAQPLAGCTLAFAGIARGLPEPFFGKVQCDLD